MDNGLKVPAVRATMLAGVFTGGVGIYVFYALQPYLLNLWGDPTAYGIAGLVAAIVAGAQIVGGLFDPEDQVLFRRRTSALLLLQAVGVVLLALIGLVDSFWMVVVLVVVWPSRLAIRPIRQAYLNA